jgi:hypothetical protein
MRVLTVMALGASLLLGCEDVEDVEDVDHIEDIATDEEGAESESAARILADGPEDGALGPRDLEIEPAAVRCESFRRWITYSYCRTPWQLKGGADVHCMQKLGSNIAWAQEDYFYNYCGSGYYRSVSFRCCIQ